MQKVVSSLSPVRFVFVTCEGVEFGCICLFHCCDLLGAFGSCINNTKSWAASLLCWGSWQGLSLPFPSSTPLSFSLPFPPSLSFSPAVSYTYPNIHAHILHVRFGNGLILAGQIPKALTENRSISDKMCVIIHIRRTINRPWKHFLFLTFYKQLY